MSDKRVWTEEEEAWFDSQLAKAPALGPETRARLEVLLGHLGSPLDVDVLGTEVRPAG